MVVAEYPTEPLTTFDYARRSANFIAGVKKFVVQSLVVALTPRVGSCVLRSDGVVLSPEHRTHVPRTVEYALHANASGGGVIIDDVTAHAECA